MKEGNNRGVYWKEVVLVKFNDMEVLEAGDIDKNCVIPKNLAAKYTFIDSGLEGRYFEEKLGLSKSSQKSGFFSAYFI